MWDCYPDKGNGASDRVAEQVAILNKWLKAAAKAESIEGFEKVLEEK